MSHTLDASAVSEDVVLPAGPTRESLATRTSILAATFTSLAILSIFLDLPKSWSLSAAVLGIASAVTPGVMVAPTQIAWAERWQSYFAAVAALVVVILGPTTAAPVLAVPFVVPLAQAWAGVQDIHCRWPVPMAVCLAWLVAAPAPSSLMALQVSGALCMAAFAATEVIRDHRAPRNTSTRAPVTILEMPITEHRTAERLEAFEIGADMINFGWFFANLVDNTVELSPRCAALLTLDPNAKHDWTAFLDLHGVDNRQKLFRQIRESIARSAPVEWSGPLTLPDGRIQPVQWRAVAHVQNGSIVLVGTIADRSSNAALESELRRTALTMDALLKHAPVVMSRMEADGSVIEFRGAGLRRMGIEDNEAVGTNPLRSARKQSTSAARIRRALEGETVVYRSVGGPSSEPWSFRTFLFPDPTQGSGVIAVSIDETDIFVAEKRMQKSEERFNLAVRGAAVGIWDIQFDGAQDIYMSDRIGEMLGVPPNRLTPGWIERTWPQQARELRLAYARHVEAGAEFAIDLELTRTDGRRIGLAVQGAAVLDKSGRPVRMAGSVTDITARFEAQDSLQAQVERAESANRAKSQFVANMSHELRTPMNAIVGMSQLMGRTKLDSEQRGYCEVINRASDELLDLIEDVLDISKIEAGSVDFDVVSFDPNALIHDVVRMHADAAAEKSLTIEVHTNKVPERVKGDPTRIRQVLNNLVQNAIKFTESGMVTVTLDQRGRNKDGHARLLLGVRDTGIGIPRDHLESIFEKFAQVDASWSRSRGGTGLGLAIARQLARQMGGDIGVDSRLGAGSTFTFQISLPVPGVKQPTENSEHLAHEGHAKVLVVEDNQVNQKVIERMLQVLGHTVEVVGDGHAARKALKQHTYDLVLMDIQMPGLDGLSATLQIRGEERKSGSHTPIIALTAHATQEDRSKCFEVGMDGFVTKPVRLDVLRGEIERVLDHTSSDVAMPLNA